MSNGIVELKRLSYRLNNCSEVRFEIVGGIEPEIWFLPKDNTINSFNRPICDGSVPVTWYILHTHSSCTKEYDGARMLTSLLLKI